jgi:hypothetical protein
MFFNSVIGFTWAPHTRWAVTASLLGRSSPTARQHELDGLFLQAMTGESEARRVRESTNTGGNG